MRSFVYSAMVCAGVAVMAAGCNQHMNRSTNGLGMAASMPPTGGPAPAPSGPVTNVPYVVRAQSAGPYIDFSIYNMGTSDLEVRKEHFAMIDPDTRNVTPYEKANSVIDLPQPAIIKPNDTLKGRAIFRSEASPVGKRLVFKPDNLGTFADINRAVGLNAPIAPAAATAPMAAPSAAPMAGPAPAGSPVMPNGAVTPNGPAAGDTAAAAGVNAGLSAGISG